jgi:hypothetical protein
VRGTIVRARATASLSGFCTRASYCRIAPASWANDAPLETIGNRSAPMGCGPDVDQAHDAQRTGRLGSGALVGDSRTGPTRAPSLRPTRRRSLLSPRAQLDHPRPAVGRSRSMRHSSTTISPPPPSCREDQGTRTHDLWDHILICRVALCELVELEAGRPAGCPRLW